MSGKFFEELAIGDRIESPGRTVTETDLVLFSSLAQLYDVIHLDAERMKSTPFKERLVPGPFIMGLAIGLVGTVGTYLNRVIALLQIDELRFPAPVHPGDTIKAFSEVIEKRETRRPERGIVKFREGALNQRGEVVVELLRTVLYERKPASAAD